MRFTCSPLLLPLYLRSPMKKVLALLALMTLTLTGCSWQGEGTVLVKEHQAEYYYNYMCTYDGKTFTVCIGHVPECWFMKVRANDGEHEGCISEKLWNELEVGDWASIT